MDPSLIAVLAAGRLVQQVGRELRNAVEARLAPFDITSQQAALLLNVLRGQTGPAQLAVVLGTDTAGTTRLLDRMEAKGLISRSRHPSDRRAVVIEATEAGRALAPRIAPVFGQVNRRMLDGVSDEELRALTGLLERMLGNLRSP
ncbi:MarR family winged helix-turn-helix transcriptional regulator [Streptosporangium jomthongense]|uniref:MarR family winged helix-turn-helix transcriptional regulator n=1 Tax=Streptosporangium jomthongense TaxID=1193683 RepID=A0ABV8F8L4_9ACTN